MEGSSWVSCFMKIHVIGRKLLDILRNSMWKIDSMFARRVAGTIYSKYSYVAVYLLLYYNALTTTRNSIIICICQMRKLGQ